MSTQIEQNTQALLELLEQVNNLPDAESDSGGDSEPGIQELNVTENGTYTAPDGVDGYSPVTVNVPIPDGYIQPSGTKEITENGTHNIKEYENVSVNVPVPDAGITLPDLGDTAAQPSDIAAGKVLYDDEGNPVTGTLGELLPGAEGRYIFGTNPRVSGGTTLLVEAESSSAASPVIHRAGSTATVRIPSASFGDATAADVAAGKTFTSAAGLLVEGTAEAGGGSGGGSVETCTVTITDAVKPTSVVYTSKIGEPVWWEAEMPNEVPAPFEVVKGTVFYMSVSSATGVLCDGCEQVGAYPLYITTANVATISK